MMSAKLPFDQKTLEDYGLLPVLPRNLDTTMTYPGKVNPILVSDLPAPEKISPLAKQVYDYGKKTLPVYTFNHSIRAYYFGLMFVKLHLPHIKFTPETYFLVTMLHDLGTADHLLTSTVLSFEYSGAIAARSLLLSLSAPEPQADSVAEAIIRHQDVGSDGEIAALTAVVQLATLFDNVGKYAGKLHKQSVDDVVARFPRLGWSGCFKAVLEVEGGAKPWCHSTFIGIQNFKDMVDGNDMMKPYEQ